MNIFEKTQTFQFLKTIQQNSGRAYWVGGCVRDQFLERPIKDLDLIVCGIAIDSLIGLLKTCGHTNLVGKSFGIIKFHPKEQSDLEIDIALPRTERSTGEGHRDFAVDFDENLAIEDDLGRRDFTINAIARDIISNELVDPYNGLSDIKNKVIRTVFDNSFVEDPLRLMRAIQFAARLGFQLETNTFTQLQTHAALIRKISPERIILEIKKLFDASKPSIGFDLMRDTKLLRHVFPDVYNCIGVTQPNKNNEDVYTHTMKVLDASRLATELHKPGDLNIMFSALFHDMGKPKTKRESDEGQVSFFNHQHISTGIARRWLRDYKVTTIGVDPQTVCHLIKNHMFETTHFKDNTKSLRRFINKVGPDHIFDLIDLRLADKKGGRFPSKVYGILKLRDQIQEEISRKAPFTTKDLAVNGHDIMQMGFAAGPIIGHIQKFLMDKVLDDPDLNTKDILTSLIEQNRQELLLMKPLALSINEPTENMPLTED